MRQPVPFGKYYLLERINVGGMAEVFKAKATGVEGFERVVAVKRILPNIAEDEEFITMFVDEAKIAVQLTHANIAQIFDLGKVAESYFIALEFVRGKDLRAIFNRCRTRGEPMPIPLCCYALMKVCEGLDYAHEKRDANTGQQLNLVHRDVSPQNLLISYEGEVKIIDFGIAKAAGKVGRTQAGILKGKFGYMSPEQIEGLQIDRRSDIFGLGICLYEMLTGERLFTAETDFATLEKVKKVEIQPPSTYNRLIPPELERIVLKALAKDRDQRHPSALDLHDELNEFLRHSGGLYGRTELATFMRRLFVEEIERENYRDRTYSDIGLPPAEPDGQAPRALRPVDRFGDRPAPVRVEPAREPTFRPRSETPGTGPRTHTGQLPPGLGTASAAHAVRPPTPTPRPHTGPHRVPNPTPAPRPPAPPPRSPTPPHPGVHSSPPQMASVGARPRPIPTPPPLPAMSSEVSLDWDDEELSTQVYDKPEELVEAMAGVRGNGEAPMSMPPTLQASDYGLSDVEPPGEPAPFAPVPSAPQESTSTDYTVHTAQPSQSKTLWLAALTVFAIVATIVIGLTLSRQASEPGAIQLQASPEDAQVFLDGVPIRGNSPHLLKEVSAGDTHELTVVSQGYRSWSSKVQLQPGQVVRISPVQLEALPTGFKVDSEPQGADVYLDDLPTKLRTPARLERVSPGEHQLRLELEGYTPWQSQGLSLEPGELMTVPRVSMQATDGDETSSQAGVQPRPGRAAASAGARPARSAQPAADTVTQNPSASPEPKAVPEPTGPAAASVAAETPPASAPQQNGTTTQEQAPGTAPTDSPDPAAAIAAPNENASPVPPAAPAPDAPDKVAEPTAPPPAAESGVRTGPIPHGFLRINARPWAMVIVDGQQIGPTPQLRIPVAPGLHQVRLLNEEFGIDKQVQVDVSEGETESRVFNFDEQ